MFAGPKAALRPFKAIVPAVRVFALTPGASVFALPLDDELIDRLHAAYGTGEWLSPDSDQELRLTSSDMDFAARASLGTALAWLETDYCGGIGWQAAAAWTSGELTMKPSLLAHTQNRPWTLRPINTALRVLGITAPGAGSQGDEFTAIGLPRYQSTQAIVGEAIEIPL